MKIVIVTADYPPDVWSGIGVAVHRQAIDLRALGADVRVIVHRPADGESVPHVGDADWLHLHSLALTELALALKRKSGARLAYTVHTQPWLELPNDASRRFWLDTQTRLLGHCDRVVFLSRTEQMAAQALFPYLPPAAVIPSGVPAPPRQIVPPHERSGVIFAGRLAATKGIALLDACVRELIRATGLHFTIAGGHGDAESTAAMKRLAREHPSRCELTGWISREELDVRLAHSRLALVPSRYEPFGLVAVEAMRVGTPVLAANAGGLRESARPGSGGVLLDSADPRRWAEETRRILEDADRWTSLHRQGPDFVRQHFCSTELSARLLREVYAPEPTFSGVADVAPT